MCDVRLMLSISLSLNCYAFSHAFHQRIKFFPFFFRTYCSGCFASPVKITTSAICCSCCIYHWLTCFIPWRLFFVTTPKRAKKNLRLWFLRCEFDAQKNRPRRDGLIKAGKGRKKFFNCEENYEKRRLKMSSKKKIGNNSHDDQVLTTFNIYCFILL